MTVRDSVVEGGHKSDAIVTILLMIYYDSDDDNNEAVGTWCLFSFKKESRRFSFQKIDDDELQHKNTSSHQRATVDLINDLSIYVKEKTKRKINWSKS